MTGAPSTSSGTTPGVSLQSVIEAPRRLDELSTARVIGEAAEAVHKAQKGGQPLGTLVPQAIVVAPTGISLAPPSAASIAYSAPEKLRGQAGDRRSDVFSLGVVLWEALSHERLFDAPTDDARKTAVLERDVQPPSELNANVPAELDAICKKALERDPANRYQSAKVMAAEISAVLDDAGYPDNHDEIASYLTAAFPAAAAGAAVAPSAIGGAIAAKLAADAPATRQQLTMTMHGMPPVREPAATKPEPSAASPERATVERVVPTPEPAKAGLAEPGAAKPGAAKPVSKTMTVGSGLSLPDLAAADAAARPKLDPAKTIPAGSGLSRSDLPNSESEGMKIPTGLSPTAFMKPSASPAIDRPPAMPAPGSSVMSTVIPTAAVHSTTTSISPPTPELLGALSKRGVKPKALIVEEPKPKASISNAETVATPALLATPSPVPPPARLAGLPAMPPGASRSFDDDFATGVGAQPYPEVPVVQAPTPNAAPSDPSAAVSLPRARSASRPGNDKGSGSRDVLADWGWSTDSHAAVEDGSQYEEAPNTGRKRLMIAIGGALGAILLLVVIAVAASGGGDDKDAEQEKEPPIADTSRPTEPVAKAADPAPAEPAPGAPAEPVQPTPVPLPAYEMAARPTPTPPVAPVDPAQTEAARAEAAKAEAAAIEANRITAAKLDAERENAAKAEAAMHAKDAAARSAADKAEAAKIAKAEKAAEVARIKAEKAAAAKVVALPPPKKIGKTTAKPMDPYAPDKAPKADPSVAYKTGFQQYVRGDTGGALTTFQGSLASNPGYPPTWRGLGLVYEKMGQKSQAKKSFLRYLQLSPNASDAEQIRSRMERLGS